MKKFRKISYILFLVAVILNYISSKYPNLVETYYSKGINIYTVKFLSKLSSSFSFSYFEILIYLFVASILISLIYLIYLLFKDKNVFLKKLKSILLNYLAILSIIYFLFIALWGLNYNRFTIYETIVNNYNSNSSDDLNSLNFEEEDLETLYKYLIQKCNESKKIVDNLDDKSIYSKKEINIEDIKQIICNLEDGFENVDILNLNNMGTYSKAKIILNSKLLSYTNITGIYSPFTGEANINTNQPIVSMPFTILHEMAHQRGYTEESDANFLSYIACINNEDEYVNYSGYFMALRYTSSALSKVNYDLFVKLSENIDEEVLYDLQEYSNFWDKYQGKINDVSDNINDIYLKSNKVETGIKSYGEVVELLLLYYLLYSY